MTCAVRPVTRTSADCATVPCCDVTRASVSPFWESYREITVSFCSPRCVVLVTTEPFFVRVKWISVSGTTSAPDTLRNRAVVDARCVSAPREVLGAHDKAMNQATAVPRVRVLRSMFSEKPVTGREFEFRRCSTVLCVILTCPARSTTRVTSHSVDLCCALRDEDWIGGGRSPGRTSR